MTKLLQIKKISPLSFRVAGSQDINSVVSVVESAYRGESSRHGWTTEADFIEGQRTDAQEVIALMHKPDSIFLLAESANKLLASVQLERQNQHAYLGMFAVSPVCQGAGVGRALLAEAERWVNLNWHCRKIQMTVITIRQELIDWYLRRGYQRSGQIKPFPYGEPRFGLPLRDDLVLEVLYKDLPELS